MEDFEQQQEFDLSTLTYDEWVPFFFDRPIMDAEDYFPDRFLGDVWVCDPANPARIVGNMTRTFLEFGALGRRFTHKQLNQGIWAMLGPAFDLSALLWKPDVPLNERTECLRAMEAPFRHYVAGLDVPVMENGFFMWWDFVCGGFWHAEREKRDTRSLEERLSSIPPLLGPDHDPEAARVEWAQRTRAMYESLEEDQEVLCAAIFDTLRRILELDDPRAQDCALHGLGHLSHPGVESLVRRFMKKMKEPERRSDARYMAWIESCANGSVL